jgi:hypothetical protein
LNDPAVAPGPRHENWTLTVRAEGRVDHQRFEDLERALDALGTRVTELTRSATENPANTRLRRYAPADQVVARIELAGPERRLASRHAGIDVRGDGSIEVYSGRVRRQRLEDGSDDDPLVTIRGALVRP